MDMSAVSSFIESAVKASIILGIIFFSAKMNETDGGDVFTLPLVAFSDGHAFSRKACADPLKLGLVGVNAVIQRLSWRNKL